MSSLKEMVEMMKEEDQEEQEWMPTPGGSPTSQDKPITYKMVMIIGKLQNNLLLVEPTLNWITQKEAELAQAQLSVLFTEKELKEKMEKLQNE